MSANSNNRRKNVDKNKGFYKLKTNNNSNVICSYTIFKLLKLLKSYLYY